jgi:predicted outer membrane repeat protein
MKKIALTLLLILIVVGLNATIINIPADYTTVQEGIDASVEGDTILVQPGTYVENIVIDGKNIYITSLYLTTQDTAYISQTILDGNQENCAVGIGNGVDNSGVIEGFTIKNGYGYGIFVVNANPTLKNLYIYNNPIGIYCYESSPSMTNLEIFNNTSSGIACSVDSNPHLEYVNIIGNTASRGGGIYCYESTPTVENSIIKQNNAIYNGGGICLVMDSGIDLNNVLVIDNTATLRGGGIFCNNSEIYLENTTITNNLAGDGGGIFCNDSDIEFNEDYRCNIYMNSSINNKGYGVDILTNEWDIINVILDTFTVIPPTDFYASPINNFSFDILHGYQNNIINADLYVSIDGDDSNTGTSPEEPFKTIKHALSMIYADSLNKNTIYLTDGVYSGSTNGEIFPLNWSNYVSLEGFSKNETILDGENINRLLNYESVTEATISNITITNGCACDGGGVYCRYSNPHFKNVMVYLNYSSDNGGGIYCDESSPILEHVEIIGNSAEYSGGGILCYNSEIYLNDVLITENSSNEHGGGISCGNLDMMLNPAFENVTITENHAGLDGGGIFFGLTDAHLLNVEITNNTAGGDGGGILVWDSEPSFDKVTISDNTATDEGGGLYCNYANPNLINSIVWNNLPDEVYTFGASAVTADYSDIGGGWTGTGNIDLDPLFVDSNEGDYHLSWVNFPIPDDTKSPCIDAGDPSSPLDPDGTIADMGAYYFNQNVSIDEPSNYDNHILTTYPNPTRINKECLNINFKMKKNGKIDIKLYNLKGQLVKEIVNEEKGIGEYTIQYNENNLKAGIYFLKMDFNGKKKEINKIVILN